jgi:hypothetical protein
MLWCIATIKIGGANLIPVVVHSADAITLWQDYFVLTVILCIALKWPSVVRCGMLYGMTVRGHQQTHGRHLGPMLK